MIVPFYPSAYLTYPTYQGLLFAICKFCYISAVKISRQFLTALTLMYCGQSVIANTGNGVAYGARSTQDKLLQLPACSLGRLFTDPDLTTFMVQWPEHMSGIEAVGAVRVPQRARLLLAPGYAEGDSLPLLKQLKPDTLQALDLTGNLLTKARLDCICSQTGLQSLLLAATPIDDQDLSYLLSRLDKLTELDLSDTNITDTALAHLTKLPALTTLKLRKNKISKTGLSYLKSCPHLQYLDLADINLDDQAIEAVCQIKTLTTLSLARTGVKDASIKNLATLPLVTRLDLSKTELTDATLQMLIEAHPGFTALNLSETKITSVAINKLALLPSLQKLWLRGLTQFDDDAILTLTQSKSLKDIEIQGTKVTSEAITTLSQALPDCEVHSKTACACHKWTRVN